MPEPSEEDEEEFVVEKAAALNEDEMEMSEEENEDQELIVGEAYDDEEMADVQAGQVAPEKGGRARHPPADLTDDEDDDEEDVRKKRRDHRDVIRELMRRKTIRQVDAWSNPDEWDCQCEKCEHVMSQMVVRPLIEGSSRWNRMKMEAPEELLDMVMKGKLPRAGKKWKKLWKDICTTPILYATGLRKFLGKLQQVLQQSPIYRNMLDNGRLHLYQLLEFTKGNCIPFPELPMKYVEKITSSHMQKNAWCGYRQLVDSTMLWLSDIEGGKERFYIETKRMEGEDEKSYQERVTDNWYKSEDRRMRVSNNLQTILQNMQKNKPWARMEGTAAWHKEQTVGVEVVLVVVVVVVMVCYCRTSLMLSMVARLRWIVPASPDTSIIP